MKPLTPLQEYVLNKKGTEPPFSGEHLDNFEKGKFCCAQCGQQLFLSDSKLDHTKNEPGLQGWPSFDDAIKGSVQFKQDVSHTMNRVEVICSKCKGHLGHVFNDPKEKTGKHFCVNSCSLEFEQKS